MGKLYFQKDGIVNGKVEFEAGKIYEISEQQGSYARWVVRGAIPESDMPKVKQAAPPAQPQGSKGPLTKNDINPKTSKKFTNKEYADYQDDLAMAVLEAEEAEKLAKEEAEKLAKEEKDKDDTQDL